MTNLTKASATKDLRRVARELGMTFKPSGNKFILIDRRTKEVLFTTWSFWDAYDNYENGLFHELAEKFNTLDNVRTEEEKLIAKAEKELDEELYNDDSASNLEKTNKHIRWCLEYTNGYDAEDCVKMIKHWKEFNIKVVERITSNKSELQGVKNKALSFINKQYQATLKMIEELTSENEI